MTPLQKLEQLAQKECLTDEDIRLLCRYAKASTWDVRERTAEVLSYAEGRTAKDCLLSLAMDPDPYVRLTACAALENFPGRMVFRLLRYMALCDKHDLVRAYAVMAATDMIMASPAPRRHILFYKKILQTETAPHVRICALEGAALCGFGSAVGAIIRYVYHGDSRVQAFALRALQHVAGPENKAQTEAAIKPLLDAGDPSVQKAARAIWEDLHKI